MSAALKDPDDRLDFAVDWSVWLFAGDQIVTSEWIVPDGITKFSEANDTSRAVVWLSGGTVDATYEVTNRITTSGGRQADKTVYILVVQR